MDANYKNYLFDPDNSTYSPSICSVGELCYSNRIFVYKSLNDIFSSSIINDIYETNNKFNNYYYSTYFGYVNYGTSLFNGFANQMFFSFDKNEIEKLIYELEKIRIKDSLNINVSPKIASGYALDSKPDNVKFSMIYDGKYEGKEDLNYNEIVISTELSNQLGFKNPIDKDLYLLLNYSKETDGEYYFNKFKLIKLKVVGVVDSKRLQIYQKSEFSLSLSESENIAEAEFKAHYSVISDSGFTLEFSLNSSFGSLSWSAVIANSEDIKVGDNHTLNIKGTDLFTEGSVKIKIKTDSLDTLSSNDYESVTSSKPTIKVTLKTEGGNA